MVEQQLKKEIQTIDSELQELTQQRSAIVREIGVLVAQNQKGLDDKFSGPLTSYNDIQKQIDDLAATIETIVGLESRRSSHEERLKTIRREQQDIESQLEPTYQEIGRIGFSLFRDHAVIDANFSALFQELSAFQDDIEKFESEESSATTRSETSNVFGKVFHKSRRVLLRSRISGKESRFTRLLEKAGESLSVTGFIEQIDDPGLNDAAGPFLIARDKLAELDSEYDNLQKNHDQIDKELESITKGRRSTRIRQELERKIASLQHSLTELVLDLGTEAIDYPHDLYSRELDKLKRLDEMVTEKNSRKGKIAAGLEVLRLENQIEASKKRETATIEEIESLNNRLSEIQSSIESLEEEKKKSAGRRGKLSDLIPDSE